MQKTPYVFPVIGGRKIENSVENLEALNISLTDENIKELESVLPFDPGFPITLIVRSHICLSLKCIFANQFVL